MRADKQGKWSATLADFEPHLSGAQCYQAPSLNWESFRTADFCVWSASCSYSITAHEETLVFDLPDDLEALIEPERLVRGDHRNTLS